MGRACVWSGERDRHRYGTCVWSGDRMMDFSDNACVVYSLLYIVYTYI